MVPSTSPEIAPTLSPSVERISRSVRFISALTVALVALLGLASFILSFEALWHFASESGALNPDHAWLFPVMVDGSIMVFSISALRCSIVGDDTRWSLSLVVTSTAASVVFNVAHAPAGFMPALIGATPPLLLFLSFESLLRQITCSFGGTHSSLRQLIPTFKRSAAPRPARSATPKLTANQDKPVDERRLRARKLLAEGTPKRQIARELGFGVATIRRIAAELSTPADLK